MLLNCPIRCQFLSIRPWMVGLALLFIVLALLPPSNGTPYRPRPSVRSKLVNLEPSKVYKIGIKNMPPMCFYDPSLPINERVSGFYVDFWKAMNEDLGFNFTFHVYENNLDVIKALQTGVIDIGLGLSITWQRALEVEFTQPIVDGSLRIMTKNNGSLNIWEMFMPFHWTLWVLILIVAFVNAHIIWWVERDTNTYYFPKFYLSGIREGLWFSFMNLMMMDDAIVRTFPGKLLKFGSTFLGVILISSYTANLASFLTTGDANSKIVGPEDLVGTKVGSSYGSTAADYVAGYGGLQLALFPTSADAFKALRDGKISSIILDYPVLVYYSRIYDVPGITIVDTILEYDQIGLATRQNSSLIPTLNGVIVSLTQTGFSKTLSDKWVGTPRRSVSAGYYVNDTVGLWIWMLFWIVMAILAFLLKKYCVKKTYKQASWYTTLGGELKDDPGRTTPGPNLKRAKRLEIEQSLLTYSEGEETESDIATPYSARSNSKLSINDEPVV